MAEGRDLQEGPRGGLFYIGPSGAKIHVSREQAASWAQRKEGEAGKTIREKKEAKASVSETRLSEAETEPPPLLPVPLYGQERSFLESLSDHHAGRTMTDPKFSEYHTYRQDAVNASNQAMTPRHDPNKPETAEAHRAAALAHKDAADALSEVPPEPGYERRGPEPQIAYHQALSKFHAERGQALAARKEWAERRGGRASESEMVAKEAAHKEKYGYGSSPEQLKSLEEAGIGRGVTPSKTPYKPEGSALSRASAGRPAAAKSTYRPEGGTPQRMAAIKAELARQRKRDKGARRD